MPMHSRLSFAPEVTGQTEFRAHENRGRVIRLVNGQLTENADSTAGGISARVIDNGLYGFSSIPDFSKAAMDRVLNEATKNAKLLKSHTKPRGNSANWAKAISQQNSDYSKSSKSWSGKEIVERLQGIDRLIQNLGPHIKTRMLVMREQSFDKEVWTGMGGHSSSTFTRSHIYIFIGMDSPHGPIEVMEAVGGRGPIEETFPAPEKLHARIERMHQRLRDKSEGIHAESGKKTVILDSKIAGILAHEAIGHTTEADLVLGGSIAGNYLGQQVASPLISLIDFAHTCQGVLAPVPVFSDEEGVEASDTTIIENGILKGFMNNRETSAHFDQPATGHARAWGFNDEPLIRMRNTAIMPGKDKLDNMIASIDDGYYLIDHSNGQADSTSEFMFGLTCGYEIKKGKLGKAILDTTISGIAFEMLKSVTMVSSEMTWVDAGTCGKKQPMHVGSGGPAIKCEVNMGGR